MEQRGIPDKLTGPTSLKKFPAFCEIRRFITGFSSTRHVSLFWAEMSVLLPLNRFFFFTKNVLFIETPEACAECPEICVIIVTRNTIADLLSPVAVLHTFVVEVCSLWLRSWDKQLLSLSIVKCGIGYTRCAVCSVPLRSLCSSHTRKYTYSFVFIRTKVKSQVNSFLYSFLVQPLST